MVDYPQVEVTSREQWRAWLVEHHADTRGIWLVTHRRSEGDTHLPYEDVVEEALCFGWIDSTAHAVDERRTSILMTPRRKGSGWSRTTKERLARLEPAGLMHESGARVVEAARADGSWTLLDAVENLEEPPDLAAALDATGDARTHWDGFPPGVRKAILTWIVQAKRPATRERRILDAAAKAARGERANQ